MDPVLFLLLKRKNGLSNLKRNAAVHKICQKNLKSIKNGKYFGTFIMVKNICQLIDINHF